MRVDEMRDDWNDIMDADDDVGSGGRRRGG